MKTITYPNDLTITIPSSIWDLTLGQFVDLQRELTTEGDPGIAHQMRLVHILTGLSMDKIEAIPFAVFEDLCGHIDLDLTLPAIEAPTDETPRMQPVEFEVDGITYTFDPDYAFTRTSFVARAEDVLKDQPIFPLNLHFLLALIALEKGKEDAFDPLRIRQRAQVMRGAMLREVYTGLFFFALADNGRSTCSRLFSMAVGQNHEQQAFTASGVGTA
jgi:hypothetical protein